MDVRGSELQDFLRCRKRWNYRWNEQLVPKKPNNKLFFGTLFHKFLEVWYGENNDMSQSFDAMKKLFDETDTSSMDQVELDELWSLASIVARNYHEQYWRSDYDWQVIATELTFRIPLDRDIAYTGTIDLIFRDQEGRLWFADHKTTDSLDKYEKNAEMDRQISRYWWALQQLSEGNGYILIDGEWVKNGNLVAWTTEKPYGFIYNLILKDYPVPPRVLKNGSLSKDKAQKTTYEMYWNALKEMHLDESDYEDILSHLADHPKEFFRRVEVFRNQAEIDASIEELHATATDMGFVRELQRLGARVNPIYRNITSDCHWDCVYRDICLASMDGSNAEYLIDALYIKEDAHGTHTDQANADA